MMNTNGGNVFEALTFSLNGQAFALEASYVREKFWTSCQLPKFQPAPPLREA